MQGDVIVVALSGHPWGDLDRKVHLVVKWEDSGAEATLMQRVKAGEKWPVISYPYATFVPSQNVDGIVYLTKRSIVGIDVLALDNAADVLDPTKEVAIDTIPPTKIIYRTEAELGDEAPAETPGLISRMVSWFTGN